MKESLENQVYNAWYLSKDLTRYNLYDVINTLSQLKEYPEDQKPIKLKPLNIEIAMNNRAEVLRLIKSGANINKPNEAGMTPLIEAVALNNYAISKMLLENGADVNGNENFIPLLIAARYHNDMIIDLLLKYGADATILDKNGFNALHHMFHDVRMRNFNSPIPPIMYNQLDFAFNQYRVPDTEQTINCINLLVEHGIDINHSTKAEWAFYTENEIIDLNPLSLVLEYDNEEVLQKLIELGAERKATMLSQIDTKLEYLRKLDYFRKIKKYDIEICGDNLDNAHNKTKVLNRK